MTLHVTEHAAFTDTGRQRPANEDALFARTPLFAVADGMGGAKAGEIASRTAIDVVGLGVEDGIVRSRLVELIRRANRAVHEAQQTDPELTGMGTTVTVAHVGEKVLTVAHVGDSRAYLMRGASLRRLTDDHSLVEEMRRSGRLTAEEAANHPQRSIITRALGPEPTVEVDVREFELQAGDVVLLCSDGLTSMVPEPRIGELIDDNARLDTAGRALIAAANAAGGRDNITVVLARIGRVGEDLPASPDAASDSDTVVIAPVAAELGSAQARAANGDEGGASAIAPREPAPASGKRHRRGRPLAAMLATVITIGILATVGWIATRVTYFIGGASGYVAIYQGVPYELPFGLKLYREVYRSGIPIESIDEQRRQQLLDHQPRAPDDAQDLIRAVERNTLQ